MKKKFLFISLALLAFGCYEPTAYDANEFDPENYNKYLSIRTEHDSIAADGKSFSSVIVSISKSTKPANREIELTTSKGLFPLNGTKTIKIKADEFDPIDANNIIAQAQLRADASEGFATITAKVLYLETADTLKFYPVYAETITVESMQFYLKPTLADADTVVAILRRKSGTPTAGQQVDFFVINESNDTIVNTVKQTGFYRNFTKTSDDKGRVFMTFSQDDVAYRGSLTIVGQAKIRNGTTLTDSTIIKVID